MELATLAVPSVQLSATTAVLNRLPGYSISEIDLNVLAIKISSLWAGTNIRKVL
jgi:hypothetical protein